MRPEPFDALLYHFGTRKLAFLKDRKLLEIVRSLDTAPDVRSACVSAGVTESHLDRYLQALGTLAASRMIGKRTV